ELWPMRHYDYDIKSVELTAENIRKYDAVLISTAHSVYDWDFIVANAQLVVDTRNATQHVTRRRERIFKA
ncbi:MAG: nucleotide sugar dehydrogenase, partial [Calditrichaeota bacterium]|nr:nucleotide sugar dehydrogenase [Calditrichota bacterium]